MDILSFQGRASRLDFWLVSFGLTVVMLLFNLFSGLIVNVFFAGVSPEIAAWAVLILGLVVGLLLLWPITAVGVRRAHDRDASGAWFIAYVVANLAVNIWSASMTMRGVVLETAEGAVAASISAALLAWCAFFIVTLGFLPGSRGVNRYGRSPLAGMDNYKSPTA